MVHRPHNPFQERTEPHIKHAAQLAQTSLKMGILL
jgi:hypothetical protein